MFWCVPCSQHHHIHQEILTCRKDMDPFARDSLSSSAVRSPSSDLMRSKNRLMPALCVFFCLFIGIGWLGWLV